jgi:hypothetical protein
MPQQWHRPIIPIMEEGMGLVGVTTIDPGLVYSDEWSGYVIPTLSDEG